MRLRIIAAAAVAAAAIVAPAWPATAQAPAQATAQAPAKPPPVPAVGEEKSANLKLGYSAQPVRRVIQHDGAPYIKVHFARLKLAAGDYLTVADPARREVHTYRSDPTRGSVARGDASFTRHGTAGFAAMSVDGDTAVVTLHTRGRGRSGATVDRYWRGYTDAEIAAKNGPGVFSVCGNDARKDAVCYKDNHATEYTHSRAVARMLTNGSGWCTAWRVGRTNRMLTNWHCLKDQAQMDTIEVQFNYDCATCGGNDPGAGTKVGANTLLRTSGSVDLDYSIFDVDNFEQIEEFGTLFLETRPPNDGERIYIPGHGDTKPKRISLFEEQDGGAYCAVKKGKLNDFNAGYSCDTSGGNSGSPVLASSTHKVIALHHLGGCPNNQGARMELIYPKIQDLVDNNPAG